MILALTKGMEAYRLEKHYGELGTAQIASILVNQNRSKASDPVAKLKEFCFFDDRTETGEIPKSYYGSAMVELAERGVLPQWALFCFKQLKEAADPDYRPAYPALIAEDCILLHPERKGDGWTGLMIAAESAGGKVRDFRDVNGTHISLRVPPVKTKFVAEEDVTLEMVS